MAQHKRSKHTGEHAVNCPSCITAAETARQPWHADYLDTIARLPEIQRKHDAAVRRNERNQAMRDLGMVKTPYGWE